VRQNFPHVQVRSYISYLSDLEQSLEKGDVDLALVYVQEESAARFPREALLEESLYLVGGPDAELDMNTPVSLAQVREVPMILPARPHAVRELVDRECAAKGVALNITAETSAMHVQKGMVMSGVGLSILSGFVIADELRRGLVTAAPIASANLKRTLYLARSAGTVTTPAASCVLDELRDHLRQWVLQGRWPGAQLLS
jgi:DNA-binding transcriptional LysR family regulator